jgi:hypothetical protein
MYESLGLEPHATHSNFVVHTYKLHHIYTYQGPHCSDANRLRWGSYSWGLRLSCLASSRHCRKYMEVKGDIFLTDRKRRVLIASFPHYCKFPPLLHPGSKSSYGKGPQEQSFLFPKRCDLPDFQLTSPCFFLNTTWMQWTIRIFLFPLV